MGRWSYTTTATAFVAASLFACAAPQTGSTTTTTAADVSEPAPREAASREAAGEEREERAALEALPGRLECRATDAYGVTTELFLEWTGESAKGTLRRLTPSGMVSVRPVRAERHEGAIIADHPNEKDLTVHAAVVGERDGKRLMRAGDADQAWSICE
jgi:hypothetical protein